MAGLVKLRCGIVTDGGGLLRADNIILPGAATNASHPPALN